ncbi:hypothetical protein [Thermomonospora echinospora]|uniref:hypothetical protein n=1 Tax=Thermomonospora echinospora TaxID=1992 RepID=UPI001F35F990|nr:hypothetical protein [Thermomonospora echinospora]
MVPSLALGVGSNANTTFGSCGMPLRRAAGPLWSRDAGVGSNATTVRRSGPPVPCAPGPLVSVVRSVGNSGPGEDEDPFAAVRGADVGRA